MAYCEIAQQECGYLDLLKECEEYILIDRATEEKFDKKTSAKMAEVVERWTPSGNASFLCSDSGCGIVKRAISEGMMTDIKSMRQE